jgi:hypothetical protein
MFGQLKEMKITIEFEDHGQDFLKWVIVKGKVIACGPFQEDLWCGSRVIMDFPLMPGQKVAIKMRGGGAIRACNYPIEKITYEKAGK